MQAFKILGLALRFWPLINLAMRIAEEAGDENGWSGQEKQRHAVMIMQTLAETFKVNVPVGLFEEVTNIMDSLVKVFHLVGVFKKPHEKVATPSQLKLQAVSAQKVAAAIQAPVASGNDARLDELEAAFKE